MIILASLWSLLLNETPPFVRLQKAHSDYWLVNLFIGALTCPMCFSAHLFWISFFIIYGSGLGILLCPFSFWLTFLLKKYLFNIEI